MEEKQRCVIYSRISTDHQSNESAIEAMQTYASFNNFIVEQVFSESISGFTIDRDELTNLKSFIKEHNIKNYIMF